MSCSAYKKIIDALNTDKAALNGQLTQCNTDKDTLQGQYNELLQQWQALKPKCDALELKANDYDKLKSTYDELYNEMANLDVDADVPGYSCVDYDDPATKSFSKKSKSSSGINSSSIVIIIVSLVFLVLFLTMIRGMLIGGK